MCCDFSKLNDLQFSRNDFSSLFCYHFDNTLLLCYVQLSVFMGVVVPFLLVAETRTLNRILQEVRLFLRFYFWNTLLIWESTLL